MHAEQGACGQRPRLHSDGVEGGVREATDFEEIEAVEAAGCVDVDIDAAKTAGQWACAGAATRSPSGTGETS